MKSNKNDSGRFLTHRWMFKTVIMAVVLFFQGTSQRVDVRRISSLYLYEPVVIADINDKLYQGQLIGLSEDSLFIITGSGQVGFAFTGLKRVRLDPSNADRTYTSAFALAGAFLGQFLIKRDEGQADRFVRTSGYFTNVISAAALGAGLGLIGYGVDALVGGSIIDHLITGPEDIEELKSELLDEKDIPRINLYYSMAAVFVPENISSGKYTSMGGDQVVNFNTFRTARIGIGIGPKLEAGAAISSVAIPNLQRYVNNTSGGTYVTTNNRLVGYYLTGSYHLIGDDQNYGLKITSILGAGAVAIDYSLNETINRNYTSITKTAAIDKTDFSCMGAIEARLFPNQHSSVALVVEYIYVPGTTPVSDLTDESQRPLGNFSLGFSLGIHL